MGEDAAEDAEEPPAAEGGEGIAAAPTVDAVRAPAPGVVWYSSSSFAGAGAGAAAAAPPASGAPAEAVRIDASVPDPPCSPASVSSLCRARLATVPKTSAQ